MDGGNAERLMGALEGLVCERRKKKESCMDGSGFRFGGGAVLIVVVYTWCMSQKTQRASSSAAE